MDDFSRPLTDDEFVELGELLASIDEPYEPMEPDQMDGFLVAILAMPQEVPPTTWMPYVFDAQARVGAGLKDRHDQTRLETLVYRRYRSLDAMLSRGQALDPIVFPIENERGHEVKGFDSIAAIVPFAIGFYEAFDRWPGLKDHSDELVNSALIGILRHLPEELIGDLAEVQEELMLDSPLENLDQAIEDLAISVAEIVSVTRGFKTQNQSAKKPKHTAAPQGFYRENKPQPHAQHQGFARHAARNTRAQARQEHSDAPTSLPSRKKPAAKPNNNPFGKPKAGFGRRDTKR